MTVLVAFASKHGATRGIAEHIGETLRAAGLQTKVLPVTEVSDPDRYDAFVIGSAVYFDSWQKEATNFVKRNQQLLAARPVWLFSSGPIGEDRVDENGQDLREVAEPKQIAELQTLIQPRGQRVFFGALDRSKFGITERILATLPAARKLFAEGDFRDWDDITDWAKAIASELAPVPVAVE